MPFCLPKLPFKENALAPYMSEETVSLHYGKHQAGYINKLNELTNNTPMANSTLVDLIKTQTGAVYNMAAQAWNHEFFWNSLVPNGSKSPPPRLAKAIDSNFGSFQNFQNKFSQEATAHFGSGWVWLVGEPNNTQKLSVISTHDGNNPMSINLKPLLGLDVWEHSYYVDYRNDRASYVKNWWNLVNWDFVDSNLDN